MPTIRGASFNIGSLHCDYQNNIQALTELLSERDIDILCLQEFPEDADIAKSVSELTGLGEYSFVHTSESHVNVGHAMGVALFSSVPLTPVSDVELKNPEVTPVYRGRVEAWHGKRFAAYRAVLKGQPIILVVGHGFPFHRYDLENAEGERYIIPPHRQLEEWLLDLEKRVCPIPVCIFADMNVGEPMRYMPTLGERYRDCFDGEATRPSGRKTDAIILPRTATLCGKENVALRGFDHN